MSWKQAIDAFEMLDATHVDGERGYTDFVEAAIPRVGGKFLRQ